MSIRTTASAIALLAGTILATPTIAHAAFLDLWSGADASGRVLGTTANFSGSGASITAQALPGGASASFVTQVNQGASGADRGIGVCSNGESCYQSGASFPYDLTTWEGDNSELDNGQPGSTQERLRIDYVTGAPDGKFRLGSLDGNEAGRVDWVNGATGYSVFFNALGQVQQVFSSSGSPTPTQNATLSGPADGGLFTLDLSAAVGWASSIVTYRFYAGGNCQGTGPLAAGSCVPGDGQAVPGTNDPVVFNPAGNNDYLVASVGVVPVPAALPLFLSALAGLGLIGRRKS